MPIIAPDLCFSSSQYANPAITTINKIVCPTLICIPSHRAPERELIFSKKQYIIQKNQKIILPASEARKEMKETAQRKISPRTIMLDKGTATKFVSRKKSGNWWK